MLPDGKLAGRERGLSSVVWLAAAATPALAINRAAVFFYHRLIAPICTMVVLL